MSAVASFLTGRRTKWVALAAWIALVAGLGPLIGKFEDVQRNEPASFLPGGAESLAVLEARRAFPSGDATPAVIVYRRDAGLTQGDRTRIAGDLTAIAAEPPSGARAPSEPVFSEDGKAALANGPIVANGDNDLLIGAVDKLREQVGSDAGGGLVVKVSGPAGFSADTSEAFGGVNSTLLFATAGIVFLLLILIYRSPIFWLLPLLAVLLAEGVVRGIGYVISDAGVVVNGQTGGILLVLVFGAGTDYALLLTARYREELRRHEDKHAAMRIALERTGPTLLASAGTVVAGLLVLSLAQVNGTAGLGPIGALGVAVAALAMLTALPGLLLFGGRWAFWPFVPRAGGAEREGARGVWRRVGEWVAARRRRVWVATSLALAVCCLGLLTLDDDLTSANGFRGTVESVEGQELLARSFPAGANAPATILVRDPARVEAVREALSSSAAVAALSPIEEGPPGVLFTATLTAEPFGEDGYAQIAEIRATARAAAGGAVLVGGASAEEADRRTSATRDTKLLMPLILVVVLAILIALLRALVAPLIVIATVVLSFFAALGISALLFEYAFGFPGEDPSLPLYAFVFLVALGVDYNIFLMARAREEAARHGTREGMVRALSVTGAVITSAGIVLAGTFSVLTVLPIVVLTQIGVVVALGVLLDTFVVRSILVPALVLELGDRVWLPSKLASRHGTGAPFDELEIGTVPRGRAARPSILRRAPGARCGSRDRRWR